MIRLPVQALTAEAFAPYGRVVERPTRPEDAAGPGWRWWAETAYLTGDGRPFGVGYLDLEPKGESAKKVKDRISALLEGGDSSGSAEP